MPLVSRRPRPPAAVVSLLDRDERVVSWAPTASGSSVVATPRGLWWPFPEGPRRIGWHLIDKATWNAGRLIVVEARVVDDLLLQDQPAVAVELDPPQDLPPTVRTRVEASVVRTELVSVRGGEARLVARRVPGVDGVTWWARLEPGTRDTPEVRAELIAQLR